ncbi:MAG TPA: copper amine oxidase N-terminal domain-containing protein [Clostridia bacterium]|nr:copper amine oxidase N-terminal domain-containing protein [Clostridia bacterium]
MKRITSFLIVFSLLLAVCSSAKSENATINLKVNGQIVDLKGYSPYKSITGIMVPLAEASKAAGASVEYHKSTKEAEVKLNGTTMLFQAGRKYALVNGSSLAMGEKATNIKGKIFVLAKFLYEKLGGTVGWDAKTNTVVVKIKLPDVKAITTMPKPSEDIDVSMPASADFKPYIAELTPIDPDMLKELLAYKDDKDGDLKYKKNGAGINFYKSNIESIEVMGVESIKEICKTFKNMMEVENNVDYKTIGTSFIQQYRYYFMPESDQSWTVNGKNYDVEGYIKLRYDDVKKYKIIEKAEFNTDTSLYYGNKNAESVLRGRLKFMFESVDPQYFKDYSLPAYELYKWYSADVEIINGILFTYNGSKWPHSDYSFVRKYFLNNVVLR